MWVDEFPHTLYASVLLDEEGKILNWKIGNYYYKEPEMWKMYLKQFKRIGEFTVKFKEFTVNNIYEHNSVFTTNAVEWFKQFELAADHIGASPFDEDVFFKCEGVRIIKK
jgi:hypothetical protein